MEIEARVKVKDLEELKQKFLIMGAEFGIIENQADAIYKQKGKEMEPQRAGSFMLRIRRTKHFSAFTFKALTETTGSWVEHETIIENPDEMHSILAKMGYVVCVEMHKKREHGKLGDINLCLDHIQELGDHLELEVISDNVEEGKRKIVGLLNKLGYSEDEVIHDGYVTILFKQKGVVYEGTG